MACAADTDGSDRQGQWGADYVPREMGRVEEALNTCLEWVAAVPEDQPLEDKDGDDDSGAGAHGSKSASIALWGMLRAAEEEFAPIRKGYLEEMEAEAEEGQEGDEDEEAEGQGEEGVKATTEARKESSGATAA